MSAFALLIPPATFSSHLHWPTERSSTIQDTINDAYIRSFGYQFSPVTSSAQDDLTSELLRFL